MGGDIDFQKTSPEIERLLSHADHHNRDPDRCWNYNGADKGNGYGHTSRGGAHRRSYELFVGPVPPKLDVCHDCDNRPCINPGHLFPGTRKQNMEDCVRKGRQARGDRLNPRFGEYSSSAKLDWLAVNKIRESDESPATLAERYGVTTSNISKIRCGRTWQEARLG